MADLARVACAVCGSGRSRPEVIVNGYALERCVGCGFVFMNPQLTEEGIRSLYTSRPADELVEIYSRLGGSRSVQREYQERLDLLESRVPSKGRLLDFACGAGHFFEAAQKRGWDAHGTELGEWAAEAALRRGLRNMHIGDLEQLRFPEASFDVVHAAQVFEHLARPTEALGEIRRILRPGGLLYIEVPNYQTLSIVLGRDDFMLNEPPQHVNYFTPRTLRRMLRGGRFEQIRVTTASGLKWENLIGRPITSERVDAYRMCACGPGEPVEGSRASLTDRSHDSVLKRLVRAGLVAPLLYRGLKVGMALSATAIRPAV